MNNLSHLENINDDVSHLSTRHDLPSLPSKEQLNWSLSLDCELPPLTAMLRCKKTYSGGRPENPTDLNHGIISEVTDIEKAADHVVESTSSSELIIKQVLTSIDDLSQLGLPTLPKFIVNQFKNENDTMEMVSEDAKSELKPAVIEKSTKFYKKTMTQLYGADDSTLNKILSVTAVVIEQMSTPSAVDCLIEMPSWMRNLYLARHGVSRVIGVMLASRLEAAGENSIIASDGSVEVHSVLAPDASKVSDLHISGLRSNQYSSLNRLTANGRSRRAGIAINNKKLVKPNLLKLAAIGIVDFN